MRLKKFKTLAMGTILALALAACGQQETAPEPAVEEEQQTVEAAAEGEETEAGYGEDYDRIFPDDSGKSVFLRGGQCD